MKIEIRHIDIGRRNKRNINWLRAVRTVYTSCILKGCVWGWRNFNTNKIKQLFVSCYYFVILLKTLIFTNEYFSHLIFKKQSLYAHLQTFLEYLLSNLESFCVTHCFYVFLHYKLNQMIQECNPEMIIRLGIRPGRALTF